MWEEWTEVIKKPLMSLLARLSPLCNSQREGALPPNSQLPAQLPATTTAAAARKHPQRRRAQPYQSKAAPRCHKEADLFLGESKWQFERRQPRGLSPSLAGWVAKGAGGPPAAGSRAGGDSAEKSDPAGMQGESPADES